MITISGKKIEAYNGTVLCGVGDVGDQRWKRRRRRAEGGEVGDAVSMEIRMRSKKENEVKGKHSFVSELVTELVEETW